MNCKFLLKFLLSTVTVNFLLSQQIISLVASAPPQPTLDQQSQNLRQSSLLISNAQPWSSREGPRIYITPQRPTIVLDGSTPAKKTLTCQTDGDAPHMFGQLRWTGPNRTDNFDELAKRHKVSEETKNSNIWELEFREPTVDDSGIYYCFGSYLTSNTLNASIKVEVTNPIRIENCPEKQWIKLDSDDARVTCRITADMPRVQIFKNGQQIEGSNLRYKHQDDSIIINGRVQLADAGKYMFSVKSTSGDKREQIIDVQVHSKPEVVANNGTQGGDFFTAVEGQQAQLRCDATGNPHPLVHWIDPRQRNLTQQDNYIVDQESGLLIIQRVSKLDDHGVFKCVAINDDNSDQASANIFLNVDVLPEITKFDNQTADEGQIFTFECRSKGDPKPKFSIRRDGPNQVAYQNGDAYQLESLVQPEGGKSPVHVYKAKLRANRTIFGLHYCNATNKAGTAERVAQLMVRFKPDLSSTPLEQLTKYGNNLAVKCHVQAYPSPTVSFWNNNTQIIDGETDIQTSLDTQTHIVSLTLSPNVAYSKITCKASNALGETTKDIHPRFTTRPGPVFDERVQTLPTSIQMRFFVRDDDGDQIKGFKYTLSGVSRSSQDPFSPIPSDIRNESTLDGPPSAETIYTIRRLRPNYLYKMKIRAFNEAGDGDISEISFETPNQQNATTTTTAAINLINNNEQKNFTAATPAPLTNQPSTNLINTASSTISTTTLTTKPPAPALARSQVAGAPIQFIKPKTKFKCSNNTDCNNGLCDPAIGICYCKPGFTGETCSIDIDECRQAEQPCQNNGTCIDSIGHYTCECQPGFRGELCQETIDMCDGSPCQNSAKCINHRTSYTCQCEPGWQGKHCELNIDECQPNPCQNNGTCQDLIDGYKCDCGATGFIGKNCEIDFDDCAAKPCGIGARECVDLIGDFKCICHEGFEGKRCDEDIDECLHNRCENNGTCVQNSLLVHQLNGTNYSSGILSGHSTDLTTSYHEVPLSSLQLANINISKIAGFTCECQPQYYGDRCEETKKCYTKNRQELCNNDMAECVNHGSSYDCLIHSSFDGSGKNYATYRVVGKLEVHEIHVRYRSLVGGIILSFETTQPGSPVADLQLNRSGLYLSGGPINRTPQFIIEDYLDGNEREIKLLLDTPTGISSVTLSRHHYNLTDFQHEPFKGCLMEVRLNNILVPFLEYGDPNHMTFNFTHNELEVGNCKTCFEKDCSNGGQCEITREGIDRCSCPPTFTGGACELDVDECAKEKPNPCLNGGKCLNSFGHYQCNCKDGWRGDHCQEISNYCKAKQPCGSNGICKNTNPGSSVPYHCECKSTHTGINCQDRRNCKNECHPQLAQCVNNVTCACLPGKKEERTMCEYITKCEQIDGELCRNGGLCRNTELGGYYCDCLEPYHGHICELVLEKSPYDVFLLIGIGCVGFLIAAVIIVGLVIFRSVRKARATCGTYSPSTQEKYGNSACDLLKPSPPERLI